VFVIANAVKQSSSRQINDLDKPSAFVIANAVKQSGSRQINDFWIVRKLTMTNALGLF
jgi:hypothetical protein